MNNKSLELHNSSLDGIVVQGDGNNIQETSKGSSKEEKNLAEALKEIQGLLKQLEAGNPTATQDEKIAFLSDETSRSFKRRVVAALQAAGETSIEEFLDNPYVNVAKATVKGWVQAQ